MKVPYLASYMESFTQTVDRRFYDFQDQISYLDSSKTKKLINMSLLDSTMLTEAVEDTDDDYIFLQGSTYITKATEDTDSDGIYLKESTIKTDAIEPGDFDEIYLLETTCETRASENSDPDALFPGKF